MSKVFRLNASVKKQVSRGQFFGSVSGKVLIALAVICVVAAAGFLLVAPSVLTDAYLHKELGANYDSLDSVRGMAYAAGCGGPLLIAFFLIVCGYRQVTADTAMRKHEIVYLDDTGRLVCSFKLSNDARPHGMNVISVGLSSCNVSVKNSIATFSGDVLGAYITDWYEGAIVPLDKLGPMTKPFKLGLYFEPDLLETIRPLVGHWEG